MRQVFSFAALALLLTAPVQLQAQDRQPMQDPCEEYAIHSQLESLMADGYGRVCDALGSVRLTPACMNFYLRVTSPFNPPEGAARAKLAAECETTMAGGSTLALGDGCGPDADCLPADDLPVADIAPDSAVATDDPDGTMECGNSLLECVEPDWDEVPVDDDSAAGAGASAPVLAESVPALINDPALDLAFWQAIEDSDTPALFQAYLDQFPQGVFRPIAEARLATFSAPTSATPPAPAPAATPAPAPAPVSAPSAPAALYAQAMAQLDSVYALDPGQWTVAARAPFALLTDAAAAHYGPAALELGQLYELGIGTATDEGRAIALYLQAASDGVVQGWFRALMMLDQVGDNTGYVTTFLDAYRVDPAGAIASLNDVSSEAAKWLQSHLRAKHYYTGAIDGAFGPGSQAALAAYVAGGPVPAPTVTANPAPPPAVSSDALARDLQRELARVGCYQGAIDGKWGPGSARAMENFNHWWGANAATGSPTAQGLSAVQSANGLVCGVD